MKNHTREMIHRFLLTRPLACALILITVGSSCARETGPASEVRVMSFNIRYGTADDGDDSWQNRRELVANVIDEFGPDVLGLQEALRFQLDELRELLPGFAEVGVGRDDGQTAGEYSAIFYDSSRFELLDQETFWLSDLPREPGSTSWGNEITRICTWARLRDRHSNRAFFVFNTHWDHQSQESRERSAEQVMSAIRRHTGSERVVLTGDFNAGETNRAFTTLIAGEESLVDTFRLLNPAADSVGTFNSFKGETSGAKIDAILVSSDWEVLEADIVRANDNGRYPSDHFPVTAVIRAPRLGGAAGEDGPSP